MIFQFIAFIITAPMQRRKLMKTQTKLTNFDTMKYRAAILNVLTSEITKEKDEQIERRDVWQAIERCKNILVNFILGCQEAARNLNDVTLINFSNTLPVYYEKWTCEYKRELLNFANSIECFRKLSIACWYAKALSCNYRLYVVEGFLNLYSKFQVVSTYFKLVNVSLPERITTYHFQRIDGPQDEIEETIFKDKSAVIFGIKAFRFDIKVVEELEDFIIGGLKPNIILVYDCLETFLQNLAENINRSAGIDQIIDEIEKRKKIIATMIKKEMESGYLEINNQIVWDYIANNIEKIYFEQWLYKYYETIMDLLVSKYSLSKDQASKLTGRLRSLCNECISIPSDTIASFDCVNNKFYREENIDRAFEKAATDTSSEKILTEKLTTRSDFTVKRPFDEDKTTLIMHVVDFSAQRRVF